MIDIPNTLPASGSTNWYAWAGSVQSDLISVVNPSRIPMPTTSASGWNLIFFDDFNTNIKLGRFPQDSITKWGAYGYKKDSLSYWKDTSASRAGSTNKSRYYPELVNFVKDGMLQWNIHSRKIGYWSRTATGGTYTITYQGQTTTALQYNAAAGANDGSTSGSIMAALIALSNISVGDVYIVDGTSTVGAGYEFRWAPERDTAMTINVGLLTGGTASYVVSDWFLVSAPWPKPLVTGVNENDNIGVQGLASMRISVCVRSDFMPMYKCALLLWPDAATPAWPANGEIDFYEGQLDGTFLDDNGLPGMWGVTHRQGGTSTSIDIVKHNADPSQWHVVTCEFISGTSIKYFIDGVQVGSTHTTAIPNTSMHAVMQVESNLNQQGANLPAPPDPITRGLFQMDWITIEALV